MNPRASRTVPFVSKATGVPLAKIAAKLMVGHDAEGPGRQGIRMGEACRHQGIGLSLPEIPHARHFLGPEMRSTGEVMGISDSFGVSFAKASMAAGTTLPQKGTVFVSLNDNDKNERAANVVRAYVRLGFNVIATEGTSAFLSTQGIANRPVLKASEGTLNIIDVIQNGWVQLIINTPLGQVSRQDEHAIGRRPTNTRFPFITTLSAAASAAKSIEQLRNVRFRS